MSSFPFPPIYSFCPFWTIQPAMESRRTQAQMWCDIILKWCKVNNLNELKVADAIKTPLFQNKAIDRQLSLKDAEFFLDQLVQKQNAEWMDEKHSKCKIIWRKPAQWGELFYQWAHKNSSEGVVFTFFELREGDDTQGEPFHNMDEKLMTEAIKDLQAKGKAVYIHSDVFDECGVKFL